MRFLLSILHHQNVNGIGNFPFDIYHQQFRFNSCVTWIDYWNRKSICVVVIRLVESVASRIECSMQKLMLQPVFYRTALYQTARSFLLTQGGWTKILYKLISHPRRQYQYGVTQIKLNWKGLITCMDMHANPIIKHSILFEKYIRSYSIILGYF